MYAAAGAVIPLIIHLWNRKKGRTLRVGSISLLQQSHRQQAKKLQLQELLLLLLRSALIVLAALALSAPVWQKQPDPRKQKGWVLMEKKGLQQTYALFKPLIDSLTAQQYEFHYFDTDFKKDDLESVLKNNRDTAAQHAGNYWSLLSSLDQRVPATLPLYLFTTNSLQRFGGDRSAVALNLHWQTYTPSDSVSTWLAKAYLTPADSIRLVTAASTPSGTRYAYRNIPAAAQSTGDYTVHSGGNGLSVSFNGGAPVPVDTATLGITVFTDRYTHDAAYLKAAIEAVQQLGRRKIQLKIVSSIAGIPPGQDWIFWLSDQPLSGVKGKNIFVYESGKAEPAASSVQTAYRETNDEQISLYQRTPFRPGAPGVPQTIWQDGFGNPLLVLEQGTAPVYRFFSRFDPAWSDLPWSTAFPQIIYRLIWDNADAQAPGDKRIMDDYQLRPVVLPGSGQTGKDKPVETRDLTPLCWLAALMVFFTERFISFRTRKEN